MSRAVSKLLLPAPLEVASGVLTGQVALPADNLSWSGPASPSPRHVLEQVVLGALQRPPCVVGFSGGRDSSLLLALAAFVARREGLPMPVPHTRRFPSDLTSNEDEWQEKVVRHLGLSEWDICPFVNELDIIGPMAEGFISTYGLPWPAPLYVVTESLGKAKGGSLITGDGGDEVFGMHRANVLRFALQAPSRRLRPRYWANLARTLAPRPARFAMLWQSYRRSLPCAAWLKPLPLREVARQKAWSDSRQPFDMRASLRWLLAQRPVVDHARNLATLAYDNDSRYLTPLLNRDFVAAWARCGGRYGFATRTEAMLFMAQDLLPEAVLRRKSKAFFNNAYFTANARAFAESWDGTGLGPELESLVDVEALRAEWLNPSPAAPSFPLLQAAWWGQRGRPSKPSGARATLSQPE